MSARHYPSPGERFWSRVDKHGPDECWLWTGGKREGYGCLSVNGRSMPAHRFSWALAGGDLPNGLELDHLCRVRGCVNPAHLELVTRRVNILRGEAPPARNARATHCVNGHPFSGSNLRFTNEGRRCGACAVVNAKRGRDARPEERRANYARYRELHREQRNAYMRARRLAAHAEAGEP